MTRQHTDKTEQNSKREASRTPSAALNLLVKALARDAARMDYEGFSKQQRKKANSKTQGSEQ